MHRLGSGRRKVDDRQPPVPKPDAGLGIAPACASVRPAVGKRIRHGQRRGRGVGVQPLLVERHQSCDATHGNPVYPIEKQERLEAKRQAVRSPFMA